MSPIELGRAAITLVFTPITFACQIPGKFLSLFVDNVFSGIDPEDLEDDDDSFYQGLTASPQPPLITVITKTQSVAGKVLPPRTDEPLPKEEAQAKSQEPTQEYYEGTNLMFQMEK